MRIHELAVMRWLNKRFIAQEGYPIPVMTAKPKNAYADFQKAWSQQGGPFEYLSRVKDAQGRPAFRPHPEPPPYPLISVNRLGWEYDNTRSFSYDVWRHLAYPTVAADVAKKDLGNVYTSYMPQAWKFTYQIDHFCLSQRHQAYFIQELMRGYFMSSSEPTTWIVAKYPHIIGKKLVRMTQEGKIQDATEVEPAAGFRIYRTTVNVVVHGWMYDPDLTYIPSFWTQVTEYGSVAPELLATAFEAEISETADLRDLEENGVFNSANGLPAS